MSYTLSNAVSSKPENCNIGYNNSWLKVDNNAGRELYSQASFITNFDDLSVSLSAADVNIGAVHISDSNTGLTADVVPVGIGVGALRVITQDLESNEDDVTIGDRLGNFATVYQPLSALCVYIKNPTSPSPYSYDKCETRTSGNPSFIPNQILIHNDSNDNVNVALTLTSGMSCSIPVGKNTTSNHVVLLNLQVLTVDDYAGCSINFFA